MSEVIKINKGLNINLKGKAEKVFIKTDTVTSFAVKPTDFLGLIPKLSVNVATIIQIQKNTVPAIIDIINHGFYIIRSSKKKIYLIWM